MKRLMDYDWHYKWIGARPEYEDSIWEAVVDGAKLELVSRKKANGEYGFTNEYFMRVNGEPEANSFYDGIEEVFIELSKQHSIDRTFQQLTYGISDKLKKKLES